MRFQGLTDEFPEEDDALLHDLAGNNFCITQIAIVLLVAMICAESLAQSARLIRDLHISSTPFLMMLELESV